jgi:hypothetical protein
MTASTLSPGWPPVLQGGRDSGQPRHTGRMTSDGDGEDFTPENSPLVTKPLLYSAAGRKGDGPGNLLLPSWEAIKGWKEAQFQPHLGK